MRRADPAGAAVGPRSHGRPDALLGARARGLQPWRDGSLPSAPHLEAMVTVVPRGGVEASLRRELRRLPAPVGTGTEAKTALALARRLDDPETPAQAAAAVARSLGE